MTLRAFGRWTLLLFLCLAAAAASRAASPEGRIDLRPGDEVYACACGPECDCGTLSRVANRCGCGRDLVKATVLRVEKDRAILRVNGVEREFATTGRYACVCKQECGCDTISQQPGKCSCGRILLPLEKR